MSFTSTPCADNFETASTECSANASVRPPEQTLVEKAEESLFGQLLRENPAPERAPVLFILGSPRTGSTMFYQAMVRAFRLPFFCNLANDVFAQTPILVAPMLHQVLQDLDITFTSSYGKTTGPFQPSEGSGVMKRWCGGGHPSQLVSTQVLPGEWEHMAKTLAAYHAIFQKPLATKNAWNCFRIQSLIESFPNAYFLWIRRDLIKSSLSDLAARIATQGDPNVWNSATPACVDQLRIKPYWVQVVENQYEFSVAIGNGLQRHAPQSHAICWYEDFLKDPNAAMQELRQHLEPRFGIRPVEAVELQPVERGLRPFQTSDEQSLYNYVEEHEQRFQPLRYAA